MLSLWQFPFSFLHSKHLLRIIQVNFIIFLFEISQVCILCVTYLARTSLTTDTWSLHPLHRGGWMIFHFHCSSSFYFLLIEFHYDFFINYMGLTCYLYYYCIWLFLTRSSPVSSQVFCCSLPRNQSLGSFSYSPVYMISRSCIFFLATIITTMY